MSESKQCLRCGVPLHSACGSRRRNSAQLLVSVTEIVPHRLCQLGNYAPLLALGIMTQISGSIHAPRAGYRLAKGPIIGVSGRNSAPSLVSVGGIVPHHWCQWEE
ncbi:unnamed protein product [Staurois parvus]|uniref:Uncharacterized protein n=1 Tax=Staurois parvus TaxID=386267 RepID=A0ABN9AEY8_9NEOB|nr:unnamed protein product [Staurois parvus]